MVHNQCLNQGAQGADNGRGLACLDNGGDDIFILVPAGASLLRQVNKLVENLLVVRLHEAPDLFPGVLGGDVAAQLHQPVDGQPVPLFQVFLLVGHQSQLGSGVVNQGGQIVAVSLGHGISEQFHQFFLDFAGGRVENMQKGFVFAVDVRHEVFRAFG